MAIINRPRENSKENNLVIEGARIKYRNFTGREERFNPAGRRNFCLCLDEELAKQMKLDGWNVRFPESNEDGDVSEPYVGINVNFDGRIPPRIFLVTKRNKTLLDEGTVGQLDYAEIANVDIIVRPYHWGDSVKGGIKGYVKTMYVTVVEDEFAEKYSDLGRCEDDYCPFDE